jgi:hypothetical protein
MYPLPLSPEQAKLQLILWAIGIAVLVIAIVKDKIKDKRRSKV